MIPYHKSNGIIIKSRNYGETSKLITAYTKEFGKITGIAKGARKVKSRFASSLELFTESSLFMYKNEIRDLYLITQAEIKDVFFGISRDVSRFAFASAVSEFYNTFVPEKEKNPNLYSLLKYTLNGIDKENFPERVFSMFMVKFLTASGYKMNLNSCASCGDKVKHETKKIVSAKHGGVVCERCAENGGFTVEVFNNTVKVMEYMQKKGYSALKRLNIDTKSHKDIEKIVSNFLEYNFESKLKSFKVMESMKNYGK